MNMLLYITGDNGLNSIQYHHIYSFIACYFLTRGLDSFKLSIDFLKSKPVSFSWASLYFPVSSSLSSGQFPSIDTNSILLSTSFFCIFKNSSNIFLLSINSNGISTSVEYFLFGLIKWNSISLIFSITNGIDQLNKSIKLGKRYGCGLSINCWMFTKLFSNLMTAALLL